MSTLFDGFVPFNFAEGVPYVSVTKNGVTFNKGVIMKLQFPRFVCLLINANTKQVALQACAEDTDNAVPFFAGDKRENKVLCIRWNGKDLLNTLSNMMAWDLNTSAYRIDGKLIQSENAILFDFAEARELK